MRLLLICSILILIASCGGGGSGDIPSSPQPPGEINLLGEWKMELTIPDCPSKQYKRLYTFTAISIESNTLLDLTESGEFPDINNVAACLIVTNQIATSLSPYHTIQLPIQFKEMLSLKFGWDYKGITIKTFTDKKIVVARTVNFNNTGDRIWTYSITRIPPLTEVSDSIILTGQWSAVITMSGCNNQTYERILQFHENASNTELLDHLSTTGIFPGTATADRCSHLSINSAHGGIAGYPVKQTAIQFKEMIEVNTWHQVVIDTWSQTKIIMTRSILGTIATENAELIYTLTKL